jgi:phosphoglycerate dehydrogenase-like enzyme
LTSTRRSASPGRDVVIRVGPHGAPSWLGDSVRAGGAQPATLGDADALIWYHGAPDELASTMAEMPSLRWVALGSAGIEAYLPLIDGGVRWTAARAIYGDVVAEHALALLLAGVRGVATFSRRTAWSPAICGSLYAATVAIIGGGGICSSLVALLQPFGAHVRVVRRHPRPMAGTALVAGPERLNEMLAGADAVVLACPLTDETRHMMNAGRLALLAPHTWLVNVGRGGLVATDDLVDALGRGVLGGAALDVTEPEPLPAGHPLWSSERCIVTPHSANPIEFSRPRLAAHLEDNVRRFARGEELLDLVDQSAGY